MMLNIVFRQGGTIKEKSYVGQFWTISCCSGEIDSEINKEKFVMTQPSFNVEI